MITKPRMPLHEKQKDKLRGTITKLKEKIKNNEILIEMDKALLEDLEDWENSGLPIPPDLWPGGLVK